jgi:hypothetical protein
MQSDPNRIYKIRVFIQLISGHIPTEMKTIFTNSSFTSFLALRKLHELFPKTIHEKAFGMQL